MSSHTEANLDVKEGVPQDSYPGARLGSIYEGRWMVEPDIESIKCTMGLEHLRGQGPESLGREIRSMSFTETYQLLSTNWLLCASSDVSKAMADSAQQQGSVAIIGHRPDRTEPRENKRRPKVLKLMTVPRKIYHAALAALSKIT